MKRLFVAALLAGGLLFAAGMPAHAQAGLVAGNVWQVTSGGVYIQNTNGITFVPGDQAEFVSDGMRVDFQYLGVGQPVNAYTDSVIQQGQSAYYPNYAPSVYARPSVVLSLPIDRRHDRRAYRQPRYRQRAALSRTVFIRSQRDRARRPQVSSRSDDHRHDHFRRH